MRRGTSPAGGPPRVTTGAGGPARSAAPEGSDPRAPAGGEPRPITPEVVENPLSGERIRILRRDSGPDGSALEWELLLAPGGRVPSSHAHPRQRECFGVLDGELEFRIGWRRLRVRPGESVTVPPGRVHHFANRGTKPAMVHVQTTPALDMEALLRTAAALATDQSQAGRRWPRLVDLALFMREFRAEVAAPWLPAAVVSVATRPVIRLARRLGRDQRYRRLRDSASRPA